jgi:V/A-type H+-transporting ATPase subunit E
MALEKVVDDILESARKDANQLVASAENEKADITRQANEAVASKKSENERQLADAIRRLRQQEVSSAELEAKRVVLNAKKDVLDQTLQEAMKELAELSDSEKSKLYAKIIDAGTKVISKPKVYCPKGDSNLVPRAGVASVAETDMGPGLVLESKDGMILLDYKFKTIMDSVWEKELKNVSNLLFG